MGGEASPVVHTPAGRVVARALEEVGFGPYQLMALVLTGGIMFAEGSEMLVMSSMTTLLKEHWELNAFLRGLMVSIVFIGVSVGNAISGAIGDRFGRRPAILLSYALVGLFGFFTAAAAGAIQMLILRFFVGVGCGIGFPAVYTLIPEVCPSSWRGAVTTLMIGFMPLGELFAATAVRIVDPDLKGAKGDCQLPYSPGRSLMSPGGCTWKSLCELSAIPAFIFVLLSLFLLAESPQYLANQGRHEELERQLARMSSMNGRKLDLKELRTALETADKEEVLELGSPSPREYSYARALDIMTSGPLRTVTIFMCFAHYTKDFSFFGLGYVLPQYFAFLQAFSVGLQLIIVSVLALPGVALAYLATRRTEISRVTWMSLAAGLCSIFAFGMLQMSPKPLEAPSAYLAKVMALAYFIFTVVYTSEAFPVAIRNTAVGCCTCTGRVGSISAPLVFEVSKALSNSFDVFTGGLIASLLTVAVTAPLCLPAQGLAESEALKVDEPQKARLHEAKSYERLYGTVTA